MSVRNTLLGLVALLTLAACSSNTDANANGPGGGADPGVPPPPPMACSTVAAARETVRVENDYGTLEGTLDVPEGCGPMPVVVILSGSGVTDRDGNVPGDDARPDIYRVLAQSIYDSGFAVLR